MEPSEREPPQAPVPPEPKLPSAPRGGGRRLRHPGPPGYFLRALSLSALFHLAGASGISLALLWASMRAERDPARRDSFVAALEEPLPDPLEPEEEPPPELEEPEPEDEPELVEQPPVFDQIFPPEEPEPEPLDWLPEEDPFADLDPEPWIRPAEPEPEPVVEPPPPVVPPEPEPVEEPAPGEGKIPVAILNPKPRYPRKAVALGWEGTVRLRIQVDAEGKVIDVEVVESTGHEILDQAAVRAFRRWVFEKRGPGDPEVRSFVKDFVFVN